MNLNKIWQLHSKITEEQKSKLSDYPEIIAQLLVNRNIFDRASARTFFASDWQLSVNDPFLFNQMKEAVSLIIKHLKAGNKIAVVGDYDADGVTSSALLYRVLTAIKGQVEIWIPSRLGEGYGLSKKIIDQIIEADAKLLITVDNGIRAKEEVAYAKQKGVDVIVTDHHMGPEDEKENPDCLVIDPVVQGERYPFKALAGVGVAFKLVSALIQASNLSEQQKERILESVLDLVAIGTIADCVAVTNENRSLIRQGLIQINKQLNPGVRALISLAGVKGEVGEWSVGWQLAPRLNVAGRLDHANTSYQLLITDDQDKANELAEKLNNKNSTRQSETARIVEYCEKVVETTLKNDKLIVLTSPDLADVDDKWLEGVIGLVAGRICEKYARPTLVICASEGQIKGSGRSVETVNIVDFLGNFKDLLLRFGGHKMACGFTIKDRKKLDEFVEKARNLAEDTFKLEDLCPRVKIDLELEPGQITGELADQLVKFSPFGQANPMPTFVTKGLRIMDLMPMGGEGQHWKMRFGSLSAIFFNGGKRFPDLVLGDMVDLVYTLEWNEYNGYRNLQLKIVDLHITKE